MTKKADTRNRLLDLVVAKYRGDPEGFRRYLPEVAQALETMSPIPRVPRSPFGLTERERTFRQEALRQVIGNLDHGTLSPAEDVHGLEHCATLIEDDSLPEDIAHETLMRLLRAATGKSPASFKKVATLPTGDAGTRQSEVVKRLSVVRGVVLNLTTDMRLVSVSISPHKLRERRKILSLVGVGRDTEHDVAKRHDEYLTESEPHANS